MAAVSRSSRQRLCGAMWQRVSCAISASSLSGSTPRSIAASIPRLVCLGACFLIARLSAGTHLLRVTRNKCVPAESLAIKKHAPRQTKRGIEAAIERGVEPLKLDAEIAQETLCHIAPQSLWRLDRLTAAIADQRARAGSELIALGMAAEIVVIVDNENAGVRPHPLTIKPCRRKPADAAADHDQVVVLLDCRVVDAEALAFAGESMRNFERTGMLAAHAGQSRRIWRRSRGELRRRSQTCRDCERGTSEKIATPDGWHPEIYHVDGVARDAADVAQTKR